MPSRVLLVDDVAEFRIRALSELRRELPDLAVEQATDAITFERALAQPEFDAVVASQRLRWCPGPAALEQALRRWPDVPVVLYSGAEGESLSASVITAIGLSARRRERKTTEDMFRIMFEQSLSGLYVGTFDGRLVDCNPAFARMFGYASPEELRGKHASQLVPDPRIVESSRRQMLARDGSLTNVEALALRKDGSVFHAMYSARLYAAGDRSLVIATLVDVTDSLTAREELRRAALEWRTTFDGISSPILVVRPDGNVIRVNAAGRALAGHDYPAIIGQRLDRIAPGEPWRAAWELTTSPTHGEPRTSTVHDPQTGFTWEISAFPAGRAGQSDRFITLVLRDITEVVGLQESLVRNQTMSALGQLIAGVAHEVRSPLFGISATLDAFEARFGAEPAFRTYLDNLRREIERMNDLMRDLLELGRPATTPRQPERLAAIIGEALEACRLLAAERNVVLEKRLSPAGDAAMVLGDRRRLVQVFENLLKNAIQHSPEHGVVAVMDQPDRPPRGDFTVAVEDEGSGFQREDLPHVFEPFFTRRSGGTGLGLPIVLRIIEDHGGWVRAENRSAGGAMVLVTLPVHDPGTEGPA